MGSLQVATKPTRLNASHNIFLIRSSEVLVYSKVVADISDHWPV